MTDSLIVPIANHARLFLADELPLEEREAANDKAIELLHLLGYSPDQFQGSEEGSLAICQTLLECGVMWQRLKSSKLTADSPALPLDQVSPKENEVFMLEMSFTDSPEDSYKELVFSAPLPSAAIDFARGWPRTNGWCGEVKLKLGRHHMLKVEDDLSVSHSMTSYFWENVETY